MRELRHTIVISGFLTLCGVVILASLLIRWDTGSFQAVDEEEVAKSGHNQSYFKSVSYYVLKKAKPFMQLDAAELNINHDTDKTYFFDPKGVAYTKDGVAIKYTAAKGLLNNKLQELFLEENVDVVMQDSQVLSDKMLYKIESDELISSGEVKTTSLDRKTGDRIKVESERVISWPRKNQSRYEGNVRGKIIRKRVYEESVEFKSNNLHLDLNRQLVKLEGDVFFKKQQVSANSRRGEIFLENYNKKLKYFVLYDDVKVKELVRSEGPAFERRAFAEKLEGMMAEGLIVLTGYPKVYQMQDVIKGNRIILRENNEVVEVDDANTSFRLK